MKSIKHAILNVIVVALCFFAIIGYFFDSLFKAEFKVTFSPEIAELIFPAPEEGASDEEKLSHTLITELAKQRVSISLCLDLTMSDVLNCSLANTVEPTMAYMLSFTDGLAESLGNEKKTEIETAVTKASVSTVVKMEVEKFAEELGKESQEVLTDLGIDDEYISQKTDVILDAVKSETATVDSVADSVMEVIDDLYLKVDEHPEYADQVADFTEEDKEALRQNVEEILSNIAEEDGSINGDELISTLINEFLSQQNSEQSSEGTARAPEGVLFSDIRFEGEQIDEPEEKDLTQTLKDEFRKIVTPEVASVVKTVFSGLLISVAFSSFWWLFLIIKILVKINSKNPLIKLKSAIWLGWSPFVALKLIPDLVVGLLSNPPAFLTSFVSADILATVKTVFTSGATATFTSSSVFAFIAAIVLLVFSFFYASARRKAKRSK